MDRIAALEAYNRIVELGSFTAAARDLELRQATVSRWIAELEDELQVQLLDRTTRSVRVTEAGQRFYQQACQVLSAWSAARAEARREHAEVAGRLRVSVPVVFGERFIAPAIPELLDRFPGLEVELQFSDRYVDLVREGMDVAVRVGRPVDSEYRAHNFGSSPRRLVASPDYLERVGVPESPADLTRHQVLLHSGLDNRVTWRFQRGGQSCRVDVRGRFSANHSATLVRVARAGHGIALLASWLVDQEIDNGQLVSLLDGYLAPPAAIQALYGSTRHKPRAVDAFIEFLDTALQPALEFEP